MPVDRADKIVSVYVLHNLGPGLAGLIVAAIVAAALSPSINALAATTVNDFYQPYIRPGADDAHLLRVSRVATVGWGLVQLAVALAAQFMQQGVLDAGLTVLGLSSGAIQRVHQLHDGALAQRMVVHHPLQLTDQLGRETPSQIGFDSSLDCLKAQLLETRDLGTGEAVEGEVLQRRSPPQSERASQDLGSDIGFVGESGAGFVDGRFESAGVDR